MAYCISVMALVFIQRKDGTKNKYRLPAKEGLVITLGRNADCVISLPDVVGLSGLHCSIVYKNDSFYIKDEGSTNGVYRTDTKISSEEALQESTDYLLGEATLTYDAQGAAVPALPVPNTAASKPAPKPAKPINAVPKKQNTLTGKTVDYSAAKPKEDGFAPIYAVIIVIISFIAGMTLRHWKDTGGFFPKDAFAETPTEIKKVEKPASSAPSTTSPSPSSTTPAPAQPAQPAPRKTALGTAG